MYHTLTMQQNLFTEILEDTVALELSLKEGKSIQVLQSKVYLNADSSRLSKQLEVVRATQIKLNELRAVELSVGGQFVTKDTTIEVDHGLLFRKTSGRDNDKEYHSSISVK